MQIKNELEGGVSVISVTGKLDGASSSLFTERLDGLFTPGCSLLLDFSGVDFVSSAGLRSLLGIAKKAKATGSRLAICGLREPVRETLEITGLLPMMTLFGDRAAGVGAMG
jgi:anti-anti-sigma factor